MYKDLIGIPYEVGGRGPKSYDCYGLIMDLMLKKNIEIPDYRSPKDSAQVMAIFNSEIRLWEECELKEGAVLLFRVPGNYHVGYYIGKGQFIHTWQKSGGVVIEKLSVWKKRLVGIYEYRG